MAADADVARELPIRPDERSGVLHPGNLARYDARWILPDPAVAAVVDQYWHVSWALDPGERLDQRIIDSPAVTVTAEDGDVPASLVVTGVQSGAWRRTIHGSGHVFAIRLRPAGLAVASDLSLESVADATLPLTETLDARLHALMHTVASEPTPHARARAADAAVRELLRERPPSAAGLLANDVLDELIAHLRNRAGAPLAQRFGVSERTIQRALADTVGHGPKWVGRRLRLQEVALALVTRPADDVATIAADLGYADQSHLTGDFRAVAGITPGTYRRDAARLRGL